MTKQQRAAAITVLLADCATQKFYLRRTKTDEGTQCHTCAVGALAQAAGVPDEVLLNAGTTCIHCRPDDEDVAPSRRKATETIRNAIYEKFGINASDLSRIQRLNDAEAQRLKRVHEVTKFVGDLPTTD